MFYALNNNNVVETGLVFAFDVKTTLDISDITFYPSQTSHSYDVYASANDKEDLLFLNLQTGKQPKLNFSLFDLHFIIQMMGHLQISVGHFFEKKKSTFVILKLFR